MTSTEAKRIKLKQRVKWASNDTEFGRVTEKGDAGIRVTWDDGTVTTYLYVAAASLDSVEIVR
jgi:hypothetical protein